LVASGVDNVLDGFLASFLISADKVNDSIEFSDFFSSSISDSTVGSGDDESLSSHVSFDLWERFFPFCKGFVPSVHELKFADGFHLSKFLD
jgi:hypothetical protein